MTIYSGQVSASGDDGDQAFGGGGVGVTAATSGMKAQSGFKQYWAGRILNVTIPAAATISAASLGIWTPTASQTMAATIYANKVANPSTLSTTTSYISGLASTTATASWSAASSAGAFVTTSDISAIITELIGQGSWASGNAMLPIIECNSGGAFSIENYDGSPSEAAELNATYTASGGGMPLWAIYDDPMSGGMQRKCA